MSVPQKVVIVLLLGALRPLGAHSAAGFTVADFLAIRQPSDARLAPDARSVAYVVERADSTTDQWLHDIWIVAMQGGAPRRLASGVQPTWAPDSRQLAYFVDDLVSRRLVVQSIDGVANVEAEATRGWTGVSWSPDSRTIAFTRPTANSARQRAELCIINVASREIAIVPTPGLEPQEPAWAPDGSSLAFSSGGDIYLARLGTGSVQVLVSRPGLDIRPIWSPDGTRIAFASAQGVETNGELRISVVTLSDDSVRDLGAHFDRWLVNYPPGFVAWSADGKSLYFTAISRMRQRVYAIDIARDRVSARISAEVVLSSPSISTNARVMAFIGSSSEVPGDVYAIHLDRHGRVEDSLTRLTWSNPRLPRVALGARQVVRWRSTDGEEIEGLLMMPVPRASAWRTCERSPRPPLVVLMEGTYGTFDQSFSTRLAADGNSRFGFEPHLLVARGFAVLMPNARGSWGYGKRFARLAVGDFGLGPNQDIVAGVDALVTRGMIDGHRVAIVGLFYDAYRALFALTQTDRFRAAVVGMPIYDLTSWYAELGQAAPRVARLIGGTPADDPEKYQRLSPSTFSNRLRAPTLIFSGSDPAWGLHQARALDAALQANHIPADFFTIGNLDEGEMSPSAFAALYRRELDWLSRWTERAP